MNELLDDELHELDELLDELHDDDDDTLDENVDLRIHLSSTFKISCIILDKSAL